MIVGYHLIWTAYGWWLPNDPRGSMSHEIRIEKISELGEAHYGRERVQPPGRDIRRFYEEAKEVLKHPLLTLSSDAIADAFAETAKKFRYTCYACAIMPDHVHALIRRHRDHGEEMILKLQEASRSKLVEAELRESNHPVWGGPGWKVFLESREDIE